METRSTVQTVTVNVKADKGHWTTPQGQLKIMDYLGNGFTVALDGTSLNASKSVKIPSI